VHTTAAHTGKMRNLEEIVSMFSIGHEAGKYDHGLHQSFNADIHSNAATIQQVVEHFDWKIFV
jgi:hypothetical protein